MQVNFLNYSKTFCLANSASLSAEDWLETFHAALKTKRAGMLVREHGRLRFKNLYLNKLDLLPIPSGVIQVEGGERQITITLMANYHLKDNPRGKMLAITSAVLILLFALYKTWEFHRLENALPSIWIFASVPVYMLLLWLFVFGLNSLYTRIYLIRWIGHLVLGKTLTQTRRLGSWEEQEKG